MSRWPEVPPQAVQDYLDGLPVKVIQSKYDLTRDRLANAVKRAGHPLRSARPKLWTQESTELAAEMYRAGKSQREIGETLGVAQTQVSVRLRAAGVIARTPAASGAAHGSWRGGRVDQGGYDYVRPSLEDMAFCRPNASGYVAEHRLVIGRILGRPLEAHETVHHIDGNRDNNDPSNLQLRLGHHGAGVVMQCNSCGSHDINASALV